ncbi:hypothetical protein [Polyangium jinanense]|uniref:Uncharacterized protein n=1 Tax=Polyangium jinanense TaxID=2829994 RepID=A0A9X3XHT8_9BACT|nr:hypothetical protein [Polyangium jinanense]MDC3962532.1 hypothetical protein [Polyangium jinanense]MDC3989353.1 hypothetical protein [Polyangium jinanense]
MIMTARNYLSIRQLMDINHEGHPASHTWDNAAILLFLLENFDRDNGSPMDDAPGIKPKPISEEFGECYREHLHINPGSRESLYYRFGEALAYWNVVKTIRYLQSFRHCDEGIPNSDKAISSLSDRWGPEGADAGSFPGTDETPYTRDRTLPAR